MKIAIDIDDVLSDSTVTLLEFYNKHYEPRVLAQDLGKYSYWGFLGKTREEANERYFKFTSDPLYKKTPPIKGAQDAIRALSQKHELYIITGRPLFTKNETGEWLDKYFPGVFKGIHYTNNLMDMNNFSPYWGRPKADICDEIGASVLIDDLHEYLKHSGHLQVYLMDKPWNKGVTDKHVQRVSSWAALLEIFEPESR